MSSGAAVAGSIEYLVGLDDTQLVQGLARLPQRVTQAGQPASQAAQRIGAQLGGALTTSMSAQLGQQLQTALRSRLQAATRTLPDITVGADTSAVDRGLSDVRARMQALSSQTIGVDLDAASAQSQIGDLLADLRQVAAQSPDIQVRADAESAIRQLEQVRAAVRTMPDGTIRVDADTEAAERALRELGENPANGAAGERAGESLTEGLSSKLGILSKAGGPIVGSILGAVGAVAVAGVALGATLWGALQDGMAQESRNGLFKAQTGLDKESVARYARAAGESYAQNFGESVDDNLEAARMAIQSGLLGGDSTQVEITDVTNKLQTVAQILGEEVPAVAKAAGQAVKTGLSANATEAFDLITRAQQRGLNVSEDLLDTINEYGTQFRKVGLDGPTALGLVAQAVRNGARDVDLAADAVKEFSLRSIDGSAGAADAYQKLGFSAQDMIERIAGGGPEATRAMGEVFEAIRQIEDPATRSAVAVGLFGTQAEDLGAALNAFDLSTARAEFGDTAGVIDQAMSDIGDNTAGKIESARRSIEISTDGIKAAIAAAFGPQLGQAADFITNNRAAVTEFLFTAGNGAIELARTFVNAAADGIEAFGELVSTSGPQVLSMIRSIIEGLDSIPGVDMRESIAQFDEMATKANAGFAQIDSGSATAADKLRSTMLPALDTAQDKFNEIGIPAIAQARFTDATNAMGRGLDGIAAQAQNSQDAINRFSGYVDMSTESGRTLDGQLRTVSASMLDQASQGATLGQTQEELTGRYHEGRDALIGQLEQMGLTRDEADRLAASYGLVPGAVDTIVSDSGTADAVRNQVERLNAEIGNIKDKTVTIKAMLQGVTPAITGGRPAAQGPGGSGGQTAYDGGGWTGPGAKYDEAGIVHADEFVVRKESRQRFERENPGALDHINRTGTLPGYADGGQVGSSTRINMPSAEAMLGAQNSMLRSFAAVAQQMEDAAIQAGLAADAKLEGGNFVSPGGGGADVQALLAYGRALRGQGISVTENRALGDNPRPGAHSAGGYHYKFNNSGAIDINAGAGESTAEKRRLSPIALDAARRGFGVIWLAPNHYNHAHIDVSGRKQIGNTAAYMANGGAVRGAGSATSDSIPAYLSNGEHVWTADEVSSAGGHASVEALRRSVRGYANGGTVQGSSRSTGGGYDLTGYLGREMNPAAVKVDDSELRKANLNAVSWASAQTMAEMALADAKRIDAEATDALRDAESKAESARRDVESATEKVRAGEEKLIELRGKKASAEQIADAEKDLKDARKDVLEASEAQTAAEKTLQGEQARTAATSAALYQANVALDSARAMSTGATKEAEEALKEFNAAQATALAYAEKIASAAMSGSNVVSIFGGENVERAAEYARYAYDAALAEAKATTEAGSMQAALDAVAAAGAKVASTQQAMGASYSTVSGTLSSTRAQVEALAKSYGFSAEESRKLAESAVPLANSGETLVDSLTRQLESVQEFSTSVDTLRKLGLSQALLDEVLEAGPAQGAQVAESILAGGKDLVNRLNGVQAELDKASQSLGISASGAAYGSTAGGLPTTGGITALPQVTGGLSVSRGTRTTKVSSGVGSKVEVNMRNEFTITDASMAATVSRQQRLELIHGLAAVGL